MSAKVVTTLGMLPGRMLDDDNDPVLQRIKCGCSSETHLISGMSGYQYRHNFQAQTLPM
jgi:hypothetical protein